MFESLERSDYYTVVVYKVIIATRQPSFDVSVIESEVVRSNDSRQSIKQKYYSKETSTTLLFDPVFRSR